MNKASSNKKIKNAYRKISRATHTVVVIKAKKHLEEQENLVSIKDQIVAAIGHLSLTVHL